MPSTQYCVSLNCVSKKATFGDHGANSTSKVHGANMGPIWGRQDPGGPHVDPMNLAIWVNIYWTTNMYVFVH